MVGSYTCPKILDYGRSEWQYSSLLGCGYNYGYKCFIVKVPLADLEV